MTSRGSTEIIAKNTKSWKMKEISINNQLGNNLIGIRDTLNLEKRRHQDQSIAIKNYLFMTRNKNKTQPRLRLTYSFVERDRPL